MTVCEHTHEVFLCENRNRLNKYSQNLYNYYCEIGKTSLVVAADKGHPEIVTLLLDREADIEATHVFFTASSNIFRFI